MIKIKKVNIYKNNKKQIVLYISKNLKNYQLVIKLDKLLI